jgi:hypothetical protein
MELVESSCLSSWRKQDKHLSSYVVDQPERARGNLEDEKSTKGTERQIMSYLQALLVSFETMLV